MLWGIEKNRFLEFEHSLCSSSTDVIPKIPARTFSFEGTPNNSQTRNI